MASETGNINLWPAVELKSPKANPWNTMQLFYGLVFLLHPPPRRIVNFALPL